jgi:hypothetical protein
MCSTIIHAYADCILFSDQGSPLEVGRILFKLSHCCENFNKHVSFFAAAQLFIRDTCQSVAGRPYFLPCLLMPPHGQQQLDIAPLAYFDVNISAADWGWGMVR